MNGKIDGYATVVDDNGQAIGSLPSKTAVDVVKPFGKPANQTGEWVKVVADSVTGWVLSAQVHAPYHGGKREGAGRKPLGDAVRVTVVLTSELVAKAEDLGGGNVSEGIRIALQKEIER